MLSPASIKFRSIRIGQLECAFALILTETLPQSHRELGSVTGRELEKFCQRTRRHKAIVARLARRRNEPGWVPRSGLVQVSTFIKFRKRVQFVVADAGTGSQRHFEVGIRTSARIHARDPCGTRSRCVPADSATAGRNHSEPASSEQATLARYAGSSVNFVLVVATA